MKRFDHVVAQVGQVVLGKEREIRLALACLLARGHLLIEDIPGIGKTTLAKGLAACLGLAFQRVQFTSDLLPGDVLGVSVYDRDSARFVFHPGPIFTQVMLADEINRATPKTQSALLEAMEERQVTADGQTRPLPQPFFVIATQNPIEQSGTFPLPDSQLDRFLLRVRLGYPGRRDEARLLALGDGKDRLAALSACMDPRELAEAQRGVETLHASAALIDYVLDLVEFSRRSELFQVGLSPRAGLGLLQAARAFAWLQGRDSVLPEDVQDVLPWAVSHRLRLAGDHRAPDPDETPALFEQVPIP